jgi:hypothetical protein
MPPPDHEIIKTVLAAVLSDQKHPDGRTDTERLDPRPGTITAAPPVNCSTADTAWAEFCQLDGPGWLQNAHTQAILHGDDLTRQLADCKGPHWPVAGERVSANGRASVHLRRTSAGWEVTKLEESDDPTGLLLTHRLLSTDLKKYLVYHVAYRPEPVGNHQELRPFASRFVGFEKVEGAAKPSAGPLAEEGTPLEPVTASTR